MQQSYFYEIYVLSRNHKHNKNYLICIMVVHGSKYAY